MGFECGVNMTEKHSYEIIVLDLDGTLTNRDKVITPKTKQRPMELRGARKEDCTGVRASDAGGVAACERAGAGKIRQLYSVV